MATEAANKETSLLYRFDRALQYDWEAERRGSFLMTWHPSQHPRSIPGWNRISDHSNGQPIVCVIDWIYYSVSSQDGCLSPFWGRMRKYSGSFAQSDGDMKSNQKKVACSAWNYQRKDGLHDLESDLWAQVDACTPLKSHWLCVGNAHKLYGEVDRKIVEHFTICRSTDIRNTCKSEERSKFALAMSKAFLSDSSKYQQGKSLPAWNKSPQTRPTY